MTIPGECVLAAVLLAVVLGVHAWAHGEEGGSWKAGVARCDITPEEPMWLAGYGSRTHTSEGALHPLWAKALVLEDAAGHRAALVTSDLLGFPKAMSDRIRDRLRDSLQLARADIVLSGSHTHTGPVLEHSLYSIYPLDEAETAKIERYSKALEDRVVALVAEAAANLAPASLSSANGVTRFAVNRRNNPEAGVPDNHDLKGPSDHAVPVLKVARADGSPLAVVFGYACHNTTLDIYQWSGDYAGFAQIAVEASFPGATAMFFEGCGADQNPLPRRSVALAQQYGKELAAAVERVLADPMTSLTPALKTAYTELDLALVSIPTRDELAALLQNGSVYDKRAADYFLKEIDAGRPLPVSYPYPIQLWRIGEHPIVILGGEVVVDYAISMKGLLGSQAFVMGYANDVMAYIPSVRVLKEGGYEGGAAMMLYGLPGKWREDIEPRILETVTALAAP